MNDVCVYNITDNTDTQLTIILHVDDIMITCVDKTFLNKIIEFIAQNFPETDVNNGITHNYICMIFEYTVMGKVRISQPKNVNDLINMSNIDTEVNNPTNEYLFNMKNSVLLDDNDENDFHTCIALLLYLGIHTQPDMMLHVTYTASRVQPKRARQSRYYFIKDQIDEDEIMARYCPNDKIIADLPT